LGKIKILHPPKYSIIYDYGFMGFSARLLLSLKTILKASAISDSLFTTENFIVAGAVGLIFSLLLILGLFRRFCARRVGMITTRYF